MAEYFPVRSSVIHWACQRNGVVYSEIAAKHSFKNLLKEVNGVVKLTMSQMESLSKVLRYPVAYLMLNEPVTDIDKLQINDFRTIDSDNAQSSINLCEQIKYCKNQQDWFIDYIKEDYEPFEYIGKFNLSDSSSKAGSIVREYLNISPTEIKVNKKYLNYLKEVFEDNLILVSISKVLKNANTRLQVSEFRGFALSDKFAPYIFINGNDAISAQIFTLCHELGHICLGLSGVSDIALNNQKDTEKWCNEFAANMLMPKEEFICDYENYVSLSEFVDFAKNKYFVSTVAILIRSYNLNLISKDEFNIELENAKKQYEQSLKVNYEKKRSKGGDFYRTIGSRLSGLLTRTLIASTSVGQTPFRDAAHLLGLGSVSVFDKLSKRYV